MEGPDVKEMYSVPLISVRSPNCMSWSEDHKISVVTSGGIHIIEITPNPNLTSTDLTLKRSVIKPTDDSPTSQTDINVEELLCKVDQREVYEMVLDTKLTPRLSNAKPMEVRFVSAQWSPSHMYQDHRCMLATLTCAGCLKIHVPFLSSWIEITDLSKTWVEHCKRNWSKEELTPEAAFSTLKTRASELKITGMTWSTLFFKPGKEEITYMSTISHSGQLAIWKFSHLDVLSEKYEPILMTTFQTNLYNTSSLYWIVWDELHFSVIAGDMNGLVKMVSFHIDNTKTTVSLDSLLDIWDDKDHMTVSSITDIHYSECDKNEKVVVVAKNSYIIVFLLNKKEVIASSHSFVGSLFITGVQKINDKSFLVSTFAGYLCQYHIEVSDKTLTLSSKQLTTNVFQNDLACYGIVRNGRGTLWALCASICKLYDHLVVRRPSQLIFISLPCVPTPSEDLYRDQNSKLWHHWENLEFFRLDYMKQQKSSPIRYFNSSQDLGKLFVYQLQLELCMARMNMAQMVASFSSKQSEICAYVISLEEIILCQHACRYIQFLTERHKLQNLSDVDLKSLGYLRSWLRTWFQSQSTNTEESNKTQNTFIDSLECGKSIVIEAMDIDTTENDGRSYTVIADGNDNMNEDGLISESIGEDLSSSSDSTSSSTGLIISNSPMGRASLQHIKYDANIIKINLQKTREQVASVLSLPVIPGMPDTEVCKFCNQEIIMNRDWRTGACPNNHRLSRCCHCLNLCYKVPYRICELCPVVACADKHLGLEPYCTFCDSPLIMDEKFQNPKVMQK